MGSLIRKFSAFLAATTFALAGHAHAAVMPFTGSLTVATAPGSGLPPITTVGSGSATLNPGAPLLSSVGLAGGTFAAIQSIPLTDPAVAPIVGIKGTFKNGAGSFGLGGKMAIQGSEVLCLFNTGCSSALANIVVPFTSGGVNGVCPLFRGTVSRSRPLPHGGGRSL